MSHFTDKNLFFSERLCVPSKRATPLAKKAGLLLVGLPACDGFPPFLLVWDEGGGNAGVSATNCMQELLVWAYENWLEFPVRDAAVVQHDSTESFDHIYAEWDRISGNMRAAPPLVSWRPVCWPAVTPRSEDAFLGMFGKRAERVLAIKEALLG